MSYFGDRETEAQRTEEPVSSQSARITMVLVWFVFFVVDFFFEMIDAQIM